MKVEEKENIKVSKILLTNGQEVDFKFNKLGYAYLLNNEIVSFKKNGDQEVYSLDEVKKIYEIRIDGDKTFWFVIGGIGLTLGLLVLVIKSSLYGRGFGG